MKIRIDGRPGEIALAEAAIASVTDVRHVSDPVPSRAGGGKVRVLMVATTPAPDRAEQLRAGESEHVHR